MMISLVTEKYPPAPGGLAVSVRRLAQGLAAAGHVVRVTLPDSALPPGERHATHDGTVLVDRFGPSRRADDTLAAWFDHLVATAAGSPPDLIHAYYISAPAFVAVAAARYLGVPSVISARGNDLDRAAFDPGRFAQVTWALQNASAVTAVSRDLARKVAVFAAGVEAIVIPNSVDVTLFAPGPRNQTFISSLNLGEAPRIVFVGEARRKKGLTVLLPALAELTTRLPQEPVLLLVGGVRADDEPILQVFRRQKPTLPIHVIPAIPHAQLPAYYRLADVLVLPSLHDGLPNALLEGMACACPIVASATGGIPDVLTDGVNGLLVPPGNPTALAERLATLLADPSLRQRLGQAARATVEADYTPERELGANLAVYRRVVRNT